MADLKRKPLYRRWWFWIIAGILVFLLGYLLGLVFLHGDRSNPVDALTWAGPIISGPFA